MSTGPRRGQPRSLRRAGESARGPAPGLESIGTGKRGRPHLSWSAKAIKELERKTRQWAKEHGTHPWDILLALMKSEKETTRLAAVKLWADLSAGKFTHQEIEITRTAEAPAIYLPEQLPDPAKVIPLREEQRA